MVVTIRNTAPIMHVVTWCSPRNRENVKTKVFSDFLLASGFARSMMKRNQIVRLIARPHYRGVI